MRTARILPVVFLWLAIVSPASAIDLSTIDRTIPKQPTYQSKSPKYCLLVFGPQAKTHVWLVQDGDIMHIHRAMEPTTKALAPAWRRYKASGSNFNLGDVCEEDTRIWHKNLRVHAGHSEEKVRVLIAGKELQMAGWDRSGPLEFAADPKNAPVIHFNGPLTLDLFHEQQPLRSNANVRLSAVLGTPGHGAGTFALFTCDSYPGNAWPVADIVYPAKTPGGEPILARVTLRRD